MDSISSQYVFQERSSQNFTFAHVPGPIRLVELGPDIFIYLNEGYVKVFWEVYIPKVSSYITIVLEGYIISSAHSSSIECGKFSWGHHIWIVAYSQ